MNPNVVLKAAPDNPEINRLLAVSIVLPVHCVVTRNQLEDKLKLLELKIEERLVTLYSEVQTAPVIAKLKNIIHKLDYKTHKKGIAIFVSTVSEQVYYLDEDVTEKIDIDEFFEIGGELFRKKPEHKNYYHYAG